MTQINAARIAWDLRRRANTAVYEDYWKSRNFSFIPAELFQGQRPVWLEIGAGSGWFFTEMAKRHPENQFIAVERCKKRGTRLVRKTSRAGLPNLAGFRGNAIPALIHGIPTASVERIYILYPCPWPRMSQRKNRWYLHPIMPHLQRILKPGGLLVWASDQKFYIDEARYVSEHNFGFEILAHGAIAPNPHNALELFPEGRTKFERTFLGQGLPCFEVICRRPTNP
jgi:release factor glutamine methyltransferase